MRFWDPVGYHSSIGLPVKQNWKLENVSSRKALSSALGVGIKAGVQVRLPRGLQESRHRGLQRQAASNVAKQDSHFLLSEAPRQRTYQNSYLVASRKRSSKHCEKVLFSRLWMDHRFGVSDSIIEKQEGSWTQA
jgi:hypothetical protein